MKLTRSSAWKNMAELELYSTNPYQDKAYSRLELFFVHGWRLPRAWGYLAEGRLLHRRYSALIRGFL